MVGQHVCEDCYFLFTLEWTYKKGMDKILSSTSRHLLAHFYDFCMLFIARLLRFEVVLESYDTPESNQHTFCTLFPRGKN